MAKKKRTLTRRRRPPKGGAPAVASPAAEGAEAESTTSTPEETQEETSSEASSEAGDEASSEAADEASSEAGDEASREAPDEASSEAAEEAESTPEGEDTPGDDAASEADISSESESPSEASADPDDQDVAADVPPEGEDGAAGGAEIHPFTGPSLVDDSEEGTVDETEVEDTEHFLKGLVEALLFSADKPQTARDIARAARLDKGRVQELIDALIEDTKDRGVRLVAVSEGYAFRSNPAYSAYVREFLAQRPVRLSRAQLETLAIIAYRQPLTRPEVDDIRGVDSGAVIKLLLERELIRILGKKDEPGRPMIYGTTPAFLELFSLNSLRDLPTLREFTELSDDSRAKFELEVGEPAPEGPIEWESPEQETPDSETAPSDLEDGESATEASDGEDVDDAAREQSAAAHSDDDVSGDDDETPDDAVSGDDDGNESSEDEDAKTYAVSPEDEEEFPDDEDDDDDDEDDEDDDDDDED